jgi:hypothetical protein
MHGRTTIKKKENENLKIEEYVRTNAVFYTPMYLNSENYITDNGHIFCRKM